MKRVQVLIVDDSAFFRGRLHEILTRDGRFEVVGEADNGAMAVDMARSLKPDLITMDIEMPVMNGISAVRAIRTVQDVPIVMFSALSTEGAQATLDALEAGATDFLPKSTRDVAPDAQGANRIWCERLYSVAARRMVPLRAPLLPHVSARPQTHRLVAIGASTGGPAALAALLKVLPERYPLPIVIAQHMPPSFTCAFAERLNSQCAITVREAKAGDRLAPGLALLAPGGFQMSVQSAGGILSIALRDPAPDELYHPSVDVLFTSVSHAVSGHALAIVLTGMGADGREGARLLKQQHATVWVQDEATCVVYGMPAAVADAGLADQVLTLTDLGGGLARVA